MTVPPPPPPPPPPQSKYDQLIALAKQVPAAKTVVVHPCDETSLRGATEAAELGIIIPILVGPTAKIAAVAAQHKLDIGRCEIVDVPHSEAAAEKGVELIRQSHGELLMKGSLHTDELMHAVASSATGLRTARRISHVFIMDVPTYAETLFITDAAINIFPDLDAKRDIIQNAIDLWTQVGLGTPRVAILSAVETVTSKIPSTIDAAALCKMADRGQITGGLLDGPLAFDNAINLEAAKIKGIKSEVAGRAQIGGRRAWRLAPWRCFPPTRAAASRQCQPRDCHEHDPGRERRLVEREVRGLWDRGRRRAQVAHQGPDGRHRRAAAPARRRRGRKKHDRSELCGRRGRGPAGRHAAHRRLAARGTQGPAGGGRAPRRARRPGVRPSRADRRFRAGT